MESSICAASLRTVELLDQRAGIVNSLVDEEVLRRSVRRGGTLPGTLPGCP